MSSIHWHYLNQSLSYTPFTQKKLTVSKLLALTFTWSVHVIFNECETSARHDSMSKTVSYPRPCKHVWTLWTKVCSTSYIICSQTQYTYSNGTHHSKYNVNYRIKHKSVCKKFLKSHCLCTVNSTQILSIHNERNYFKRHDISLSFDDHYTHITASLLASTRMLNHSGLYCNKRLWR